MQECFAAWRPEDMPSCEVVRDAVQRLLSFASEIELVGSHLAERGGALAALLVMVRSPLVASTTCCDVQALVALLQLLSEHISHPACAAGSTVSCVTGGRPVCKLPAVLQQHRW